MRLIFASAMLAMLFAVVGGRRRLERAAEIPSASANHHAIVSAAATSDLVTPLPALMSEVSASNATLAGVTEASSATSSAEGAVTSTSEPRETLIDEISSIDTTPSTTETTTTTTTAATTTTITTTIEAIASASEVAPSGGNSDEYFADDHAADGALTPEDKNVPALSNSSSTEKAMDQSTTRLPLASEFASRASAAVGRVLSQEENVPWPEAKSTKVIGTIIEDIQSPLQSDRQESIASLTGSAIATIVLCAFLVVVTTAGASGYWWYRRRYLNRPETLNDRYAASETGGNGDDIFRVGYIHSPEMPRDSSEEMYSLDNDSFLTSLEAMTIPTYWTETIKHTKL